MKKIISAILALSMTVLNFTALTLNVGAVANSGETVIIDDDFESTNSWGDDRYIYSWVNPAEKVNMGGEYKQVAKLSKNESGTNWINAFGKSFDKAYTDGKVLISFDTFCDAYSRFGDNHHENRSYMFLNFYQNTGSSYNDLAAQVKRTPFAIDYKSALSTLGLGAIDMSNRTNGIGTNVKMELKQWYHIDVLVEFGGKVKSYIDGVNVSEMETPADFTSLGAIAFSGQLNGAGTDFRIDNLKAIHNPDTLNICDLEVNETEKTVQVEFNRTLLSGQKFTSENVFIKRLGSAVSEVSVSEVELSGNTLLVKYEGEFLPGREYKVVIEDGVKDIFNNVCVIEECFNSTANPSLFESKTEGFEDLADGSLPENLSENKSWVGADIKYIESRDGKGIKLTKENATAGTHIYASHYLPVKNNKKGRLTYSFDTYLRSKDTAPHMRGMINGSFYLFTTNNHNGALTFNNKDTIATLPKDAWVNLKFVFDYGKKQIEYYVENELVKTVEFNDIVKYGETSGGEFKGDFSSFDFITYIAKDQSANRYLDNLYVSYDEYRPTVSSVRYFDAEGNEFLGDQLEEDKITEIVVKFNTPLNSETVNPDTIILKDSQGKLENVTGTYNETDNTYTLTVNDGGTLPVNPAYTLTVSKAVTDKAGLSVGEDIVYYFAVGTAGITNITGYNNSYTVSFGSKFAELPKTLTGLYAGGNVEVLVNWIEDGYYSKTPGTYTVKGEIITPDGYIYNGGNITTKVTVKEDTSEEILAQNVSVRKNIGETSPLATGILSDTDTLQAGLSAGVISIVSDEFENVLAICDSKKADDTGASAKTTGDGEIEIVFNENYNGLKILKDMKLMFNKTSDNQARWNIELLYKNSLGEWVVFFKDNTDFKSSSYENGAYRNTNFSGKIYPTLILETLEELNDVNGLKIRFSGLAGGYELFEADINMADDGSVISSKRREVTNPLKFSNIYSDGAVIQRDKPIFITGYGGDKNDEILVEVKDAANNTVRSGVGVSDGRRWEVTINNGISGSLNAYKIVATDKSEENNTATISDIMFGDVFIASGQSNMGYGLGNIYNRLTNLGTDEAIEYRNDLVAKASENLAGLRFFNQSASLSSMFELEDTYTGKWYKNGSFHGAVHNASAVAYFFAYDLYKNKLNEEIPVAFVEAARGGSGIKAWMSEDAYEGLFGEIGDFNRSHYALGSLFTGCYNAEVAPLEGLSFKGVIWYQGEGDHSAYKNYGTWFDTLVKDWQKNLNDDSLTFTTVQLSSWDGGASSKYFPEIRQTQMQAWQKNDSDVNMITAIEVGENDGTLSLQDDIHPLYKSPVGERLSAAVAADLYGMDIEYIGPLFDSIKKTNSGLEITFSHAEGLKAQTRTASYKEEYQADEKVSCLEISKDGKVWEVADNAVISDDKIIIGCDEGYTYVRYAWSDYPENPNLYNEADFPAFPFMVNVQENCEIELICREEQITAKMNLTDKLKLSGKLFVAVYDKSTGALKNVDVKDANFVLNDESEYSYDFGINTETEKAKAIFVDGFEKMIPLV